MKSKSLTRLEKQMRQTVREVTAWRQAQSGQAQKEPTAIIHEGPARPVPVTGVTVGNFIGTGFDGPPFKRPGKRLSIHAKD